MKLAWMTKLRSQCEAASEAATASPAKRAAKSPAVSESPSKRQKTSVLHEPLLRPDRIRHINPAKILQGELFQQLACEAVDDFDMDFMQVPHNHAYCKLCSGSEASHRHHRVCVCVCV